MTEQRGEFVRQDGSAIPFECYSNHDQRAYGATPFYRALFANDSVPLRLDSRQPLASKNHVSAPEPPLNDLEAWVCGIWQDVLKCEPIGVVDNFEAIGGHSLAAMEIITRLQTEFLYRFDIRAALAARTVREMAAVLAQVGNSLEEAHP